MFCFQDVMCSYLISGTPVAATGPALAILCSTPRRGGCGRGSWPRRGVERFISPPLTPPETLATFMKRWRKSAQVLAQDQPERFIRPRPRRETLARQPLKRHNRPATCPVRHRGKQRLNGFGSHPGAVAAPHRPKGRDAVPFPFRMSTEHLGERTSSLSLRASAVAVSMTGHKHLPHSLGNCGARINS
jgi:hypothetical protein